MRHWFRSVYTRDEDQTFFSTDPDPDRPEIEMKKKIYLYFRQVGIKFYIINHHFMLAFVDSDLYFVQD